jgi:hypothetical protein
MTVDDLTPEVLTGLLERRHPGVEVSDVEVLAVTAGTSHRVRLGLTYTPGRDQGLPPQIFLKSLLSDSLSSRPFSGMYRTEVRFFHEIWPELSVETPRFFGGEFDEETKRFVVLLEDLTLRDATFLNATIPVSPDEAATMISALAGVHACYWQSPRLDRELGWLGTPLEGAAADFWRNPSPKIFERELAHEVKAEIVRPDLRPPSLVWDAFWRLAEINSAQPRTVTHCDTHVGNTYRLPDGGVGLLDWQLMRRGSGVHDVSFYLLTALDIEQRRAHERDLLKFYVDELERRGVETPGFDWAWGLHRRNPVWGIVMWMITPLDTHGPAAITNCLRRFVSATEDHGSFELLGN